MGVRKVPHRKFSVDFKLRVLSEYYQSSELRSFIEHKYGLARGSIYYWEILLSGKTPKSIKILPEVP